MWAHLHLNWKTRIKFVFYVCKQNICRSNEMLNEPKVCLVDPDGDVGEDTAILGEVEVAQTLLDLLLGAPSLG